MSFFPSAGQINKKRTSRGGNPTSLFANKLKCPADGSPNDLTRLPLRDVSQRDFGEGYFPLDGSPVLYHPH